MADGIKHNKSIIQLTFTACNLNVDENIEMFMGGVKYNETI
jgi:hypothetical protein